ncbi:hypothetical protein B0A48_08208 [Cryoendolithus antarcticus]|uniref:Nucleoporin Nup54 alpha-helical domain-containing protein n=1 Tax=Cryoendolithus antarcticus TaxID=1507870 RepID=A0A1V8T1U4_9PEZI|nr:hypothetical protein B0A48_08208 [Cryoendolithus antarcticus]
MAKYVLDLLGTKRPSSAELLARRKCGFGHARVLNALEWKEQEEEYDGEDGKALGCAGLHAIQQAGERVGADHTTHNHSVVPGKDGELIQSSDQVPPRDKIPKGEYTEDSCKNEHPQDRSQNRYAPLQNPGGGRARSGAFGQGQQAPAEETYNVTADNIRVDLTTDRPIWPLTAYGPGRNAPAQLIEGDLEMSPEEMRVMYYLAMTTGNTQQAIAQEAQAAAKSNEAVQTILKDVDGAVKYIIAGKDRHPNRLDIEQNATQATQPTPGFGLPMASTNQQFGQPTTTGQAPSAFGQPSASSQITPAFGQPTAPAFGQATAPGFGQPSTFGKPAQPGFGQASSLGGAEPSPFGQPSALGGGGAFGQPSALGGGGAFGQPSSIGQKPAFGQPTLGAAARPAFGTASTPGFGQSTAPAFGQASSPAFGQASNPNASGAQSQETKPNPFAAAASQPSGFGAAAQQSSGFGQPSTFGAAARQASPFATAGQAQSQPQASNPIASSASPASSVFGQASQPTAERQASPFGTAVPSQGQAFGQPSQTAAPAFGQASKPAPAFGQPTQPDSTLFGQPSNTQSTTASAPQPSPFGQTTAVPAQQPSAPPSTQMNGTSHTIASVHLVRASNGQPQSYKGQPVHLDPKAQVFIYTIPGTNPLQEERLWFPRGAPEKQNPDTVLGDAWYTGDIGKELKDIYAKVMACGKFEGDMPEIPPRREWVSWDI